MFKRAIVRKESSDSHLFLSGLFRYLFPDLGKAQAVGPAGDVVKVKLGAAHPDHAGDVPQVFL